MCTHTRITPPSSRSALIASSKSRAVGGSIVKVGSARRSRRGTSVPPARSAASRASRSTTGSKRRRSPRSSISASSTSRAVSGRPIRRSSFPCPARGPDGAISTMSPVAACWPARGRSRLIRRPRAKNGSATRKRPRRSSTATTGPAAPRGGPSAGGGTRRRRSGGSDRASGPRATGAACRRAAAADLWDNPLAMFAKRTRKAKLASPAHVAWRATVLTATSSASSRRVSVSSSAFTSGLIPAPLRTPPPPRLRPLGV